MMTRRVDEGAAAAGPVAWTDESGVVHGDLLAAKALLYDPCGFVCSRPVPEEESTAYAAHSFAVDGLAVRFRVAKVTPTKVGQFVTVWKRAPGGGPIAPFDAADAVDLFVISARDEGVSGSSSFPLTPCAGTGWSPWTGAAGSGPSGCTRPG